MLLLFFSSSIRCVLHALRNARHVKLLQVNFHFVHFGFFVSFCRIAVVVVFVVIIIVWLLPVVVAPLTQLFTNA